MRRSKSIDEIYDEVRDCDLVITNDAALATGLNARIERPFVGYFAMTPRQLANTISPEVIGTGTYSELRIISTISDETGLDFRYVHSEIQNIREIRRYTQDVRRHMHTRNQRLVYDSFEALPTIERVMGLFDPERSAFYSVRPRVAIVGAELFDDLDKHFIPLDFLDVSPFDGREYTIPRINEIGNDRQVAENAVDLIDAEHASDYAIVINTSSPIADAVRAALYRRGLPFVNSLNVRDLAQIRDYLQFVTLSLSYETLRVKHVKELFANYNGFFKPRREEYLLSRQTADDMRDRAYELKRIMENIGDMTFAEVMDGICDRRARIQVGILIDDLGFRDRRVTSDLVGEMSYAVNNVSDLHHNEEIPENEKTGVLIADCSRSAFVDRPVVMFLGMEQDWNVTAVGKPYIDAEDAAEKNTDRMSILLQQGSSRLYCVNTTKNGRPARPCLTFDMMLGRPVRTFRDMCPDVVTGRWYESSPEEPVFRGEERPAYDDFDDRFSKTTFNRYFGCPRAFLFSTLLESSDSKHTEFGNLIHEFAELYACYPDIVMDRGVDGFVTMISDRYAGLSSPLMEDLDNDRIRMAMVNVMRYIDSLGMGGAELDVDIGNRKHPNRFMLELGLERTSSVCEVGFSSNRNRIHGNFDLYWNGLVTDYKTGKANDAKDMVGRMALDDSNRNPEFQPLIYLALSMEAGGRGEFSQMYALDNDVESLSPGFDITSNVRRVIVVPGDLTDCMRSNWPLVRHMEAELKAKLKPHAAGIVDAVASTASGDPSGWDGQEPVVMAVLDAIGAKDNKGGRDEARVAIRKLVKTTAHGMVGCGSTVFVPGDLLSRFLDEVVRINDYAREQARTTFPATPRIDCSKCEFREACTATPIDLSDTEVDGDE